MAPGERDRHVVRLVRHTHHALVATPHAPGKATRRVSYYGATSKDFRKPIGRARANTRYCAAWLYAAWIPLDSSRSRLGKGLLSYADADHRRARAALSEEAIARVTNAGVEVCLLRIGCEGRITISTISPELPAGWPGFSCDREWVIRKGRAADRFKILCC